MNDKDITILGFSEAGRAALALIENLREDGEELDTLKAAVAEQLPYTFDDGTDDEASPVEAVEYAGAELRTLRTQLAAEKARAEKAEAMIALYEQNTIPARDAAERARDELGIQLAAQSERLRLAMACVREANYCDDIRALSEEYGRRRAALDAVPGDVLATATPKVESGCGRYGCDNEDCQRCYHVDALATSTKKDGE